MRPAIARLYDPNQGVRDQAAAQVRRERELAANVPRALGGASGFPDRDQIAETGMNYMEMTGAPSLARGVQHVGRGEPGEAIPELLMGGLGALGMATLPYGGGAYAAATRQPMGIRPNVAQALPEPMPPIRPPARLPGRASDGSVLPIRPPEPFRNSMRGGSDDLMDAARAPDAGSSGGGQALDAGAMTALRRELRDHDFDVPVTMPALPEIEVPIGDLRQGRIGSLDRADASRYARMESEAPPLLVRRDRNGWHIIDGNRRAAAAAIRGDRTVRALDASELFATRAPDGGAAGGETWYRGTAADKPLEPGLGGAIWLSDNADVANRYSADAYLRTRQRGQVYDFQQVQPRNPLEIDMRGEPIMALYGRLRRDLGVEGEYADVLRQVRERGHDAIVIRNVRDQYTPGGRGGPQTQLAVLDPAILGEPHVFGRPWRAPDAPNAGPPRPPPRLPGRASDGSVLPIRPSEPFRNSMRGGSDDLVDAARAPGAGRQRGFHGSLSNFDRFDSRYIGTGKGLNAQGWGVNITDSRAAAQRYAARDGGGTEGVLYDVDFPEGPFLDDSLPFEAQPPEVQALGRQLQMPHVPSLVDQLSNPTRFRSQREAAEAFRAAGVRGLRYRLERGREPRGFLIFDPADATIVARNGEQLSAPSPPPRPRPPPRRPQQ